MGTDENVLVQAQALARVYVADSGHRPVGVTASREALLAALPGALTEDGDAPAKVVDDLARLARTATTASTSPRYFGFVIGGSHPVALATDWLVSAWDQNAGLYATSPLVSVAEEIAADWLLDLLDLPREASVGFVTGCQMAHVTCLAAARHAVMRDAGHDVEADGLVGAPRVNIVGSAEAHVTIDDALRYLGFGTKALQRIETDGQGRMRADALAALLPTLSGPTIVC